MSYSNDKFSVITRTWFGKTNKHGGNFTSAYTFGSGTVADKLARWYPKGPIKVLKIGHQILATLSTPATGGAIDVVPYRIYKSNAAGAAKSTLIASNAVMADDANREAIYAIGSKETIASAEVEAGRFITLRTATPVTGDATAGDGTVGGSAAFFIDWVPKYSAKWEI